MNHSIGQVFHAYLLNKDKKHLSDYLSVTKMAINSSINVIIQKAPFEALFGENIQLPIILFLSRESSIKIQVHIFTSKMKLLVYKVKSAICDT